MKRSILVAAGTAAGVTAAVSYHAVASPTAVSLQTSASAAVSTRTSTGATSTAKDRPSATATQTSAKGTSATTSSSGATTTTAPTARAAVGQAVGFPYGQVQVKVTEHAGKITNVSIAAFGISDPHSESIDQFAVPQLRQQVIAAQSAHIDGVSGASYTSQAYAQSVQSALDKLA